MTEKELLKAKTEVESKLNINAKKMELYKEMEILEKDPKIRRYLKLKNELIPELEENFSLSEIYVDILKKYGKLTEDPNNLYLFIGMTTTLQKGTNTKTIKYMNVETGNLKIVPYYLMKEFEDNNNIVRINGYSNAVPTTNQIKEVINYYYQELYKTNQEEATIKTKSKTKF